MKVEHPCARAPACSACGGGGEMAGQVEPEGGVMTWPCSHRRDLSAEFCGCFEEVLKIYVAFFPHNPALLLEQACNMLAWVGGIGEAFDTRPGLS